MDQQPAPGKEIRLPNEFIIPERVAADIQRGTRTLAERLMSPTRPDLLVTLRRSGTMLFDASCKPAMVNAGVDLPPVLPVSAGTTTADRYTRDPDSIKDNPQRYFEWMRHDEKTKQEILRLAQQMKLLGTDIKTVCIIDDCSNEDITLGATAPYIVHEALVEAGFLKNEFDVSTLTDNPNLLTKTKDMNQPYADMDMGGITIQRNLISGPPWLDKVRSVNIPSSAEITYPSAPIVMDKVMYELMKGTTADGTPITWEYIEEYGKATAEAMNRELEAQDLPPCPDPTPLLDGKIGRQELMGVHTKLVLALQKVGLNTLLTK